MSFVGMETDRGREHAERLRLAAQHLESLRGDLDSGVQGSTGSWVGPDAEGFRGRWTTGASPLLQQLIEGITRCGTTLEEDAAQQDTASDADGQGAGGGGGRGAEGGGGSVPPGARQGGGGDGQVPPDVAEAWEDMNEEDQKKVLQEIARQELEAYGAPELTVYFDSDTGVSGYWIESGGLRFWRGEHIVIDDSVIGDPDSLNTVAHEARHAAQNQWIEDTDGPGWKFWADDTSAEEYDRIEREYGVTQEEIEAWRENDKDYKSYPDDPQPPETAPLEEQWEWYNRYLEYREQPLEVDAFDTGDEFAEEMTMDDLRQYQEDARVPVSP
jgi:uncharacterized protein YukE